ncbi:SdrD B-like domain-containing protein [Roseibacillus persicicus]|uniref:Uncharacterized protein n=1 Tax=Roseibacillus persicicus TaxID=454148 RepID=A0A918TCY6_9BACT|nr:SdrD B-like domain-containing protein [Roseibacillus persicicus]GHC42184.1 hypothetical protein GCM10007100_03910 [Roseibacillus persicicus]
MVFVLFGLGAAQAQIVFEADFENTTGSNAWTFGGGAVDGNFAIGTPAATDNHQLSRTWDGTGALVTGLAGGTDGGDDVDTGSTFTISPAFTVPSSATADARLEMHYYFSHSNAAAATDLFQVILLRTAGNLVVFQETGVGTVRLPQYSRLSLDLSDYEGETLQLAFQVTTTTASIVEAAIDSVQVMMPSSLGGTVWNDANDNGILEGGESGLEGVLVELLDSNNIAEINPNLPGDRAYVVATDSFGNYEFNNLLPGDYKVKIATPPGAYGTSSADTDTADNQQDNDDNGIQDVRGGEVFSPVINLTGAENDETLDFGLVPSPTFDYTFNSAPTFQWFDGLDGAVWNATDTSATYDIDYTDSFGNAQTLTVTMTIVDPDNRNGDDAADTHSVASHPFDPAGGAAPWPGSTAVDDIPGDGSIIDPWDSDTTFLETKTNGAYGLGFLTMGVKTATSDERVAYRFSFSKPVRIIDLEVGDIDGSGIDNDFRTVSQYELPGNSFQDRVEFYGRNGDVPVQMTVASGAQLGSYNGTVFYEYDSYVAGNLEPTDPLGTTTVSSDFGITELDIYYSNGGDDAAGEKEKPNIYSWWTAANGATNGVSDDQAIRINGFGLVVADDASITGNVSEDTDGDDLGEDNLAGVSLTLYTDPNGDGDPSDGAIVDNPNIAGAQDYVVTTDASGNYVFSGLAAGDYVVVETQPTGYVTVSDGDSTDAGDDTANASIYDNRIPVSLEIGEADSGNDFVEEQSATISGNVGADTNNDNNAEVGIEGVTLTLVDGTGDPIDGDPDAPGVQTVTAVTNGDGDYIFEDVPAGTYAVAQTQPSGYLTVSDGDATLPGDDAANTDTFDNSIPVTVAAGETDDGNNFIEEQPGTISGTVTADTNNDDVGETNLEGVVITLTNAAGEPIDSDPVAAGVQPITATTDANGVYTFTNLPPGDYGVSEAQPTGYINVLDGDSTTPGDDAANADILDDFIPVSISANETDDGNDFVEEAPATISGSILADTNNDDAGDVSINVVTIELFTDPNGDGDPVDGALVATQVTSDGTYGFTGLSAGAYVVVETQPNGYVTVTDEDSVTDTGVTADASNASAIDNQIPVTVDAGETDSGNDFVEELPATISGSIFADTDNDDDGDVAIDVVTVELFTDPNGDGDPADGALVATQVTTDGTYSFTGLSAGSYVVVETQPGGYLTVSDGDSVADTGATADASNVSLTDNQIPVTVDAGETDSGNDFIEEQPGIISGTVTADTNNDDVGETNLEGVVITLTNAAGEPIDGDPVAVGVQLITATTDANGIYTFTDVPPGDYGVLQTQPSGYLDVLDGDSTTPSDDAANTDALDNFIPVSVTAGETDSGNDFIEEQPGIISGTVTADTNNDDVGETNLEGVVITLTNAAGEPIDGDPVAAGVQPVTATTDANGVYSFTNLAPGDYGVSEGQPSGYISVLDGDSTTPGDDAANADTLDDFIPVSISANETDDGNDFVEELPAIISGSIFADTDNDDDGDIAIDVVTVELFSDPNGDGDPADGVLVATQVTTDGTYSFTGLPAGSYVVVETQPGGYLTVSDGDSVADTGVTADASNASLTDNQIPVTVDAGETDSGNDFIEEQPGIISGTVTADTNNDDVGETNLEGVVITLTNAAGEPIDGDPVAAGVQPVTATTDANGVYSFTNLPPGDYGVSEGQPSGYISVLDGDSTTPGDDAANADILDDFIPVSISANETDDGNDFVEELPAIISGSIFADTDNDDNGDIAIDVVTVELFSDPNGDGDPADGALVATQVTTDGTYSFTGLPAGSYVVVETQPGGYLTVSDGDSVADTGATADATNASVTDNQIPVTVDAGETDSGNDFIEEQPGIISGTVTVDTDNDNIGDTDLEGVVVTLTNAAGEPIDGDPVAAGVQPITATTDANGVYSFTNLAPGDYGVSEGQPSGYINVLDGDSTTPGDDAANADILDDFIPVSISANETDDGNDFVEELPAIISGSIFADTDNDDNGDIAIDVVTIELFSDPNGDGDPADGVLVATQVTTDGTYSFTGLPAGSYVVVETQPGGYLTVSDGDSVADTGATADASNASLTDNQIPVTVDAGETDSGNDFIEEQPGVISGTVTVDTDNDNIGDTDLEGVVVTLTNAAGEPIDEDPVTAGVQPITATTDANGVYTFTDVPPGDYGVLQTQPSGYLDVLDGDSTIPGDDDANADTLDDFIPVSVVANETDDGNDFVEYLDSPDSFTEFQTTYAPVLGSENEPGDNPDGDYYPNALEYAFYQSPGSGAAGEGEFCLLKDPATGAVSVTFFRRRGGLSDVTYTLEGADTLATPTVWTEITSIAPVTNTTDPDVPNDAEKVTYSNLQTATELTNGAERGVIRMAVEVSGQTYYTEVFGWQCVGYNDYQCATFSNPFKEKPVFSGTFPASGTLGLGTDANGNLTLDVSDSANGADISSLIDGSGTHYLQITGGLLEGHRFDILSGGVNQLTLINDPDLFERTIDSLNTLARMPADSEFYSASYQIIRYQTVDEQYDRLNTFAGEEDTQPGDFTRVLFYDARSSAPGFAVLGLIGTSTADSKWVFTNDLGGQNNQGGMRLEPGAGTWVHPKSSGDAVTPAATPVEMFSYGVVADYDQALLLNEGYNLVGALWPLDQSVAGTNGLNIRVEAPADFTGSIDPTRSTEWMFWNGDLVVDEQSVSTYSEGYDNYMLLDGGGMQQWVDINDFTLQDLDELLILESHRAAFLKLVDGESKQSHIVPQPNF